MKTIIVAGITRSGLTLTMQMLNAGGYPCYGDYPSFELAGIGKIPFTDYKGYAIKSVDTQLQFPPPGKYHVIRLRRDRDEQIKSICKFIEVLTGQKPNSRERSLMANNLVRDYANIDAWAKRQFEMIVLNFEEIITKPALAATKIRDFTGVELNLDLMIDAVVKRETACLPYMLETKLINENIKTPLSRMQIEAKIEFYCKRQNCFNVKLDYRDNNYETILLYAEYGSEHFYHEFTFDELNLIHLHGNKITADYAIEHAINHKMYHTPKENN